MRSIPIRRRACLSQSYVFLLALRRAVVVTDKTVSWDWGGCFIICTILAIATATAEIHIFFAFYWDILMLSEANWSREICKNCRFFGRWKTSGGHFDSRLGHVNSSAPIGVTLVTPKIHMYPGGYCPTPVTPRIHRVLLGHRIRIWLSSANTSVKLTKNSATSIEYENWENISWPHHI